MRLVVCAVALLACRRVEPPRIEDDLPCVVGTLVARATPDQLLGELDVLPYLAAFEHPRLDREQGARFVQAVIAATAVQARSPQLAARGALTLALLGQLPAARALAGRALGTLDTLDAAPRAEAAQVLAMTLAWTGDLAHARQLAGASPRSLSRVAQGLARAGDLPAARRMPRRGRRAR